VDRVSVVQQVPMSVRRSGCQFARHRWVWFSDYATDWTVRGPNAGRDKNFVCSPKRSDRLCDRRSFLSNGFFFLA